MSLNYHQTCPDINRNIGQLKQDFESLIDDIIEEINPLFKGQERTDYIKNNIDYFYDIFEKYFENVREQNADIRSVADKQIEELEQELEEAHRAIAQLEKDIDMLQE